ncbi:hypothetical protein COV18_03055 [Candidatus Woesearchaeota archaeon CG10_big_fil_rev_8_21_14_0_10_37_12]|nr:MAG: hypothetical protein COV18_03055 [Candidatus Woesearchaeota archaeon CG10_big_fil_rev_8_21_14_0_10_37_12]
MDEKKLNEFIECCLPEYKEQLAKLVRIPSISSFEENKKDVCRVVEETKQFVEQLGFNEKPLFVACGGTIGSVPQFQRVWNVPVVLIAQSLLTDNYHGPNEEFHFKQAKAGMKTIAKYISSIGELRES